MSEPSQEPSRIGRARAGISRWRSTRRGTKTLKAAYQQAARDVKRMDPAVRERIGRANMTKADLQMLADTGVAGSFRADRYGQVAQALASEATARVQQAGTSAAPTRNPIRGLANRVSRWRNTRQGTKALKAAYQQAARDVKRMDPSVREAIGRSTITKADLQALSQGQMDQVFRPEGRMGALPQQQGQQQQLLPPEQMGQGQLQQAGQVQQLPQQLQPQQDRTMQLMAEINQLQAQAAQLLQVRIAQLQAETAQLQALQAQVGQQAQAAQQLQPEAGQQQPEAQKPEAQQPEVQQLEAEAGQQPEVAENSDYVGKHRVVETQRPEAEQPAQQGPDPNNAQHWVDTAAGRPPAEAQAAGADQEAEGQPPNEQQTAPGEAAKGERGLTVEDMNNHHAALNGMAAPQPSTKEAAGQTAAAAGKGLHKAGQAAERQGDTLNR